MLEYVRDERRHAGFGEAPTKKVTECGIVRDFLAAAPDQFPVLSGSFIRVEPAHDPPDCIAEVPSGAQVAFEVTELVSRQAVAQNIAAGRDRTRSEDAVYWDPSREPIVAKLQEILDGKDAMVHGGGPYSETVLVIHTDEFALSFDELAPELQNTGFKRTRRITRAFLFLSYDSCLKRKPYVELRLGLPLSTASP
ncbi:MAG: hypothetical protein ACREAA_07580 [Candidatus Polarisedimenticolia bacterium]